MGGEVQMLIRDSKNMPFIAKRFRQALLIARHSLQASQNERMIFQSFKMFSRVLEDFTMDSIKEHATKAVKLEG